MSSVALEKVGRRVYVRGNTYPIKGELRSAGAKWDPEQKAWWIGSSKRAAIESVVSSGASASHVAPRRDVEAPGTDATVAGRARYKGRTYYVAGRVSRGRTHWDDGVEAIQSRDGQRILLYFRDGSRQFWAASSDVEILRGYQRPTTIARLREYAEQRKAEDRGEAECPVCARHCTCGTSFCHHHHDGCDRCGAEG